MGSTSSGRPEGHGPVVRPGHEGIVPPKSTLKKGVKRFLLTYGSLTGLAVITAGFGILSPTFLTVGNVVTMLRQVSIVGVISLGLTFALILGGLDFSVANVPALAGSVCGVMLRYGYGNGLSILTALIVGLAMGFVNGMIVTRLRVGVYLSGLAMSFVARGLDMWITHQETSYAGIQGNTWFLALGQENIGPLPIAFLIAGSLYVIVHLVMTRTRVGRNMYAIGGSEEGAAAAGINVDKYRLAGLCLCGLFGALGGVLLTSRGGTAVPRASEGLFVDVILAAVFGTTVLTGGVPHVLGTGVGVMFTGILLNGLTQYRVHEFYQMVVKGILVIGSVALCTIGGKVLKLELK